MVLAVHDWGSAALPFGSVVQKKNLRPLICEPNTTQGFSWENVLIYSYTSHRVSENACGAQLRFSTWRIRPGGCHAHKYNDKCANAFEGLRSINSTAHGSKARTNTQVRIRAIPSLHPSKHPSHRKKTPSTYRQWIITPSWYHTLG